MDTALATLVSDIDRERAIQISRWELARSAIEFENDLMYQRLNWHFVIQTALLTAFGFIYWNFLKESFVSYIAIGSDLGVSAFTANRVLVVPLLMVAILGIVLCLNARHNIQLAGVAIARVHGWYYSINKKEDEKKYTKEYLDSLELFAPPLHLWGPLEKIDPRRQTNVEPYASYKKRYWAREEYLNISAIPLYFVVIWILSVVGVVLPAGVPELWIPIAHFSNGYHLVILGIIVIFLSIWLAKDIKKGQPE